MAKKIKSLSNPKAAYLLEAGFDVLHHDCKEWQSDLLFWKDELTFLHSLIEKKRIKVPNATFHKHILASAVAMSHTLNMNLRKDINDHEKLLSIIVKNPKGSFNDEAIRNEHSALSEQVFNFEKDLRKLKKQIFKIEE